MDLFERADDKVLLIDIDSIIYYEAYKEKSEWALAGVDARMKKIFEETGTNRYIAFLTEGKCFRYDRAKSSEYKGNRKGREKPRWFNLIKSYLKAKYNAISIEGIEADDAVAYFAKEMDNAMICSPDKDVLKQCEGTHYNYQMITKEVNGVVEGHSKGFVTTDATAAQMFLYTQWLMGDSTDGISGIEKCGPKTAEKWIAQVANSEQYEKCEYSMEEFILSKYMDKYGAVDGVSRFSETFKLVYLLKTDVDMVREIGGVPETPEIHEFINEEELEEDVRF